MSRRLADRVHLAGALEGAEREIAGLGELTSRHQRVGQVRVVERQKEPDVPRLEPLDALAQRRERVGGSLEDPSRVAAHRLAHRKHVRPVHLLGLLPRTLDRREAGVPLSLPELDHAEQAQERTVDRLGPAHDRESASSHVVVRELEVATVAVNERTAPERVREPGGGAAAAGARPRGGGSSRSPPRGRRGAFGYSARRGIALPPQASPAPAREG